MELRISVRSLVHQLVHEQAKASVHLEGLQRDVSTLLDFRDSMMTRSLGPDCPSSPRPAAQTVGPSTVPSTPTELASGGASSGLGTSAGTSTASAGTTVTATQGGAEMARSADADELMSLLETIEAQGRRSPLLGDPPILSLPDLRPGQERLAALSLSERLLQERDALLSQLTGLEQSLRAQVDSLGRRWSARAPPARGPQTDQQDQQISVQNDSDDIRLQSPRTSTSGYHFFY
ncbi:hypothetical protein FJT64_018695 [Amphibalanus amphitrite]|uniref:Uncharacterized protein n=1 Tax=Amphibalanus amphitrite TaxID=1232801 RepID=A0A6A4WWA5_AMPAM|nr:hypothetical protein FJT64_018695 [Amphibalanus amphitrite]